MQHVYTKVERYSYTGILTDVGGFAISLNAPVWLLTYWFVNKTYNSHLIAQLYQFKTIRSKRSKQKQVDLLQRVDEGTLDTNDIKTMLSKIFLQQQSFEW